MSIVSQVFGAGNPRVKLVSMSWKFPSAEECCRRHLNGYSMRSEFSYWFCMAICTMCCATLELEFKEDPADTGATETPVDQPGDLPVQTVQDDGLSFTTSAYGGMIPIVFGSDKLTGNVFWASPIKHNSVTIDGAPQYYNTLSFAFGVCEGEINGVLRMWVGDKLIVDNTMASDGDDIATPGGSGYIAGFQVDLTDETSPLRKLADGVRRTKITVFTGSETQIPQGIMAESEGYESTPAYRGLAYVLFENFIIPNGSVPNLFVEVTSNTDNKLPRLFADITAGDDLTTMRFTNLLVDPAFEQVTVAADGSGGAEGWATFDSNRFDELLLGETALSQDVGPGANNSWICANGIILYDLFDGGNSVFYTYSPFTGRIVDTWGDGSGSIFGHTSTGFHAVTARAAVLAITGSGGLPGSTLYASVGTVNNSVGILEVDSKGFISYRAHMNSVVSRANATCVGLAINEAGAKANPTFADTTATKGAWVFIVSSRDNETESFKLQRLNVTDPSSPAIVSLPDLDFAEFHGTGIIHECQRIEIDPTDNCLLMTIAATLSRPSLLVKWSPFTGQVVWKVSLAPQLVSVSGSVGGIDRVVPYSKWAYLSSNNNIYSVDLITGTQELVVEDIGTQTLPAPNGARQFYNGYENSIVYQSNVEGKKLVKVFIDRITRQTVDLSTIVTNLLKRQGVTDNDIDVQDLSALTLNGYTIREVKTLRACFAELGQAFTYDIVESNGKIKYKTRGEGATEAFSHKWVASDGENGWLKVTQINEAERARKINLTYRDIDREYANNVQSIILSKIGSQAYDNDAAINVEVPIVLESTTAKQLAEILLYGKMIGSRTYELTLPPRARYLDPADVIEIEMPDGEDLSMRIRDMTVGLDRSVRVQAAQEDADIYNDQVNLFGNIGRFERDGMPEVTPRIDPFLMDIPYRSEDELLAAGSRSYILHIAWLNLRAGAPVPTQPPTLIVDATDRYTLDAPENFPTWGYVITPPDSRVNFFSTDYDSRVRVRLINDTGLALESATNGIDDLLFSNTVNLCYIGGELLQFANVTHIDGNVYELSVLHRAKNGTDTAMGTQSSGDRFILLGDKDGVLETGGISVVNLPVGTTPRKILQVFVPSGSPFQPAPVLNFYGLNLRPFAVADVTSRYSGSDAVFDWVRRTRFGGEWPDDGSEAVLVNETTEAYELFLFDDPVAFAPFSEGTYLRKVRTTAPTFTYTDAMQVEDGFDRTTTKLWILVYQLGSLEQDNGGGVTYPLPHA